MLLPGDLGANLKLPRKFRFIFSPGNRTRTKHISSSLVPFPHGEPKYEQRTLNVYAWEEFTGVLSRSLWLQVVLCSWGFVPKLEASRIPVKVLQRVMMGKENEGWDESSWSLFHRNKAEHAPKLSEGWLSIRLGDLAQYLSCRYNFLLKGTIFSVCGHDWVKHKD